MNDINLFAKRLKKILKDLHDFTYAVVELRDSWMQISSDIQICFYDEGFDAYWATAVAMLSDTIFDDVDDMKVAFFNSFYIDDIDLLARQMKDNEGCFKSVQDYLLRIKAVLGHDSALADAAAEQEDCGDENKKSTDKRCEE